MRLGLRHLPLLAAPLALTACPSSSYRGPVEVPQLETTIPVGAYVSLAPFLRGAGAPMIASNVAARCVDGSLCDVALVGGEVRVGGKKAGRAEVVVSYDEADGRANESRVFVNFAEGLVDPIEVGEQTYDPELLQTIEHVRLGGREAKFACTIDVIDTADGELGAAIDLGDHTRGLARLYTCLNARPFTPSSAYYRFASWGAGYHESSTPDEHVYVCAHSRPGSGEYLSLTIYQHVGGIPVLLERRGAAGDVCGLVRQATQAPALEPEHAPVTSRP